MFSVIGVKILVNSPVETLVNSPIVTLIRVAMPL